MEDAQVTRRSFLGKMMVGTLLAEGFATLGAILAYLFPPKGATSAVRPLRVRTGKAEDIPKGRGKLTLFDGEPLWVVHLPTGFVGMSALCSHKGCVIKWDEKRALFSCPCHEGLFDEQGNVVSGLPRQPLKRFRVGLLDGDVYVAREHERAV